MDSWLKKSHDNGNKRTADDGEASVKTYANRVFSNVFAFCAHWVPVSCYYFLPLSNNYKYTTHSAYCFDREGSRKFLED